MKTVIVYYSQANNTRKGAEMLAEMYHGKLVELKEKKKGNALQALFRRSTELQGDPWREILDADLVYLMFPIWAGNSVPAMNGFVRKADFRGKEVVIVTFQASPTLKGSPKVHQFMRGLVEKANGKVRETYGMVGGNMGVFVGDERIRAQIDKVDWYKL